MCNTYTVRPKLGAEAHERAVNEAISKLKSSLVRRSAPGVVLLSTDGELLPFTPYTGEIPALPCDSPLKKTKTTRGDPQGELF